jgi:hypothetical protein
LVRAGLGVASASWPDLFAAAGFAFQGISCGCHNGGLGSVTQLGQRVDQRIDLVFEEADIALAERDGLYPWNFRVWDERIGGTVKAVIRLEF